MTKSQTIALAALALLYQGWTDDMIRNEPDGQQYLNLRATARATTLTPLLLTNILELVTLGEPSITEEDCGPDTMRTVDALRAEIARPA